LFLVFGVSKDSTGSCAEGATDDGTFKTTTGLVTKNTACGCTD
jgi:hypothetical protein